MAGVQVTHNRPRNHHPGAGAKGLQRPEADQHLDGGGEGATNAGHDENRQAGIDRRLTPEHIADRAVEQLAHTDDHEEHRQAHLHRGRRGMQAGAECRQRRQVAVDGKRADGGDQPQQQGEVGDTSRHGGSGRR